MHVLASKLVGKSKEEIQAMIGYSRFHSDFNIWVYDLSVFIFLKKEMILFFDENTAYDVLINTYLFGIKIKEYFYEGSYE